jgi:HIP---CoA ligase
LLSGARQLFTKRAGVTTPPATIPDALRQAASRFPEGEAVVDGSQRLTFAELERAATEAARALIASGIQLDDRVGLWAGNSLRWIVASFGIYLAGAVQVPLNTRFKSGEGAHVARASGTRQLLAAGDFMGQELAAMARQWNDVPTLEEVVELDGAGWEAWLSRAAEVNPSMVDERAGRIGPSSMSDIIFTSGTTGAPKGAMLTHGASVRTYLAWSESVGLRTGDRYLVVYPFFHTAGLKSGVLACVLRGAAIHPFPVFDVEQVMEHVSRERITMLPGPPTVFQSILDHPNFAAFDLSSLRLSVTGAAVVPVEVVRRMRDELRFQTVVTGYGLTETTGTVSVCHHDDPPETVARTVGRPLPGVEVRVVDEEGKIVGPDQVGELLVRGFNVMKGYFNDPDATRATVDDDGWLRTGDIGFVGEDGNIRITDRKKDMYIAGGFNVYPAEVEATLLRHPAVAQVAVIGIPDHRLGEVGQAVVVLRHGEAWDADEFLAWCRTNMANYKAPRSVRVVGALPLNPSGKVMKFKLREEAVSPAG